MYLDRVQREWDELARRNPLAAILWPPGESDGWDEKAFFRTGRAEVREVLEAVSRGEPNLGRDRALDFGCGVGRLAQALCEYFDQVHGVDISPTMISLAERYNRFPNKCRYYLHSRDDLTLFPDSSFDFIYSSITLQHIKPRYTKRYLREFARLLAPSGALVFQLLGRPEIRGLRGVLRCWPWFYKGISRCRRYLWESDAPAVSMYYIRPKAVLRFLAKLDRISAVGVETRLCSEWWSHRYIVRRRNSAG